LNSPPMTRTHIPLSELAADLQQIPSAAQVIHNSLLGLLDGKELPASMLPSMHAARRAAQSLTTHLEASRRLVEVI